MSKAGHGSAEALIRAQQTLPPSVPGFTLAVTGGVTLIGSPLQGLIAMPLRLTIAAFRQRSALQLRTRLLEAKPHQVYGDCRDVGFGDLDLGSNSSSSIDKVPYPFSELPIPTYLYGCMSTIPFLCLLSVLPRVYHPQDLCICYSSARSTHRTLE